jgi:citrate lyase subunit beta / citryl-CoA lyase
LGPALLFCPGNRPDRYLKAALAADAVILDLEDAVSADDKDRARECVAASSLDPAATIIRLNPAGTHAHELDLQAVGATVYDNVMLAKTEAASQLDDLGSAVSLSSRSVRRPAVSKTWPR